MYVRDLIPGIIGFQTGETESYYKGTAGQLPGATSMSASVLAYVVPPTLDEIDLFGNYNANAHTGWKIQVDAEFKASVLYGDGTLNNAVLSSAPIEPYRWVLISMVVDEDSAFTLYVNGVPFAGTPGDVLAPCAGIPRIGGPLYGAGPASGCLVAGAAYGNSVSTLAQQQGLWSTVQNSGQMYPRATAYMATPTFTNVWQVQGYNSGGSDGIPAASWAPAVGAISLTKNGSNLRVTNAPNVWSFSGGSAGAQGAQGPQGARGAQGAQGPQGA